MFQPIAKILDDRGCEMHAGDFIVYSPILQTRIESYEVIVRGSALRVEKIRKLEHDPSSGFAQVGDSIRLTTESGEVFIGDGENGWGGRFYLLPRSEIK
jgi:hypothetical protein